MTNQARNNLTSRALIALVAIAVTVGTAAYLIADSRYQPEVYKGLDRLDMLFLNEPAPGYGGLHVAGQRTVLVFCNHCQLPKVEGGQVRQSSNSALARQYSLATTDNRVGPGYAIIDSLGMVRYRTYDKNLHQHQGEINRLLRNVP